MFGFRRNKETPQEQVVDTPALPSLIVYYVYKRRLGCYVGQEHSYVLHNDITSTGNIEEVRPRLTNDRLDTRPGDLIVALTGDARETQAWVMCVDSMDDWVESVEDFTSWIDAAFDGFYFDLYPNLKKTLTMIGLAIILIMICTPVIYLAWRLLKHINK